jgi:hypothetical protein
VTRFGESTPDREVTTPDARPQAWVVRGLKSPTPKRQPVGSRTSQPEISGLFERCSLSVIEQLEGFDRTLTSKDLERLLLSKATISREAGFTAGDFETSGVWTGRVTGCGHETTSIEGWPVVRRH